MARGKTIDAVIAEANQILRVWNANPDFSLGQVTKAQFASMIDDMVAARAETEALRTQLTEKVNKANAKMDELNGLTVRARAGFKANYGPDSSQYEQAGGTRQSERKRPAKKTPPKP